jgi:hypothetical protein
MERSTENYKVERDWRFDLMVRCPIERTTISRAATSLMGQNRTQPPKRMSSLFDQLVGAGE